jgi:hypothetical protein
LKNKIRMLPLVLLLGLLAALPSFMPVHAIGDFTVTANPSALGRIIAGSRHSVTINVTSTGGFSGIVSLSESDNGGMTASFNPTSVTVSSGGFSTSILKLTFGDCGVVGNSPLYVTGTSGTLSHQIYITYGPIVC